jgi:hypothetical protein
VLSKTDLQSYLQCARKLWLERHRPEVADADDSSGRRRAVDGNMVGEKSRQQLGDDFIWPAGLDDKLLAAEGAKVELLSSPTKAAAEFPMVHGGLYARADALLPEGGGYVLRETKGSGFPLKKDKVTPDSPEAHHLDDVAIQAWVMTQSGLSLSRSELNLLNNRWRYPGNGDYSSLFRQMDVTQEIADRVAAVPRWVGEAQVLVDGPEPHIAIGKHCKSPHPCQFQGYCEALSPNEVG